MARTHDLTHHIETDPAWDVHGYTSTLYTPGSCANNRNIASDRGLMANLNGFGILSSSVSVRHRHRRSSLDDHDTYRKIELSYTTSGSTSTPRSSTALVMSNVEIMDTINNHAELSTRCAPGHRLCRRM